MRTASGVEIVKRIDSVLSDRFETRVDLCKKLDINKSSISLWFCRDSTPKVDDIYNIADYLNVSPEWLAFGDDKSPDDESMRFLAKYKRLTAVEQTAVKTLIDGFIANK